MDWETVFRILFVVGAVVVPVVYWFFGREADGSNSDQAQDDGKRGEREHLSEERKG